MDKAVVSLEYVVSQDPTYKNSLTYLGRAYYRKERYKDAYVILQRAVAVNKDDEIAWLALGLVAMAAVEFVFSALADGIETYRRLFLFHAVTDITVCLAVGAEAARGAVLRRFPFWRRSVVVSPSRARMVAQSRSRYTRRATSCA